MNAPVYPFLRTAGRILNAGQSRSVLFTGNIYDLFYHGGEGEEGFLPLTEFLAAKWRVPGTILVVYEINGPIRFLSSADLDTVKDAWLRWRTGMDTDQFAIHRMLASQKAAALARTHSADFDVNLKNATGNPTVALEFLRQLCLCSRTELGGQRLLHENLVIIIEAADLVLPEGEIAQLADADRHRVSICHDWFSDPGFSAGGDSVVMLCESRSLLNQRVARLPQILEIDVPAPTLEERLHFLECFDANQPEDKKVALWSTREVLAEATAGLSLHALNQLLRGAVHEQRALTEKEVIEKVEAYIMAQIGQDVVEFKKPGHTLDAVIGFTDLKRFLHEELMPRLGADPGYALPGAAVCGAIGSGKTFIFEAVASELDMVVLVLKNIRSQWFGQTDVILERLRRTLEALSKVLIFVDEADTQFGGIGPDAHETERRLTGKIQAMMSDPKLRGRVTWLLMTARIHLLSPDIRRPGRAGDLIIPVLDPEGEDRKECLRWMAEGVLDAPLDDNGLKALDNALEDTAVSTIAALRGELKAKARLAGHPLKLSEVLEIMHDRLPPAISKTRRYQTLQALVNCTRRSLLPDPKATAETREAWAQEIRLLEAQGMR